MDVPRGGKITTAPRQFGVRHGEFPAADCTVDGAHALSRAQLHRVSAAASEALVIIAGECFDGLHCTRLDSLLRLGIQRPAEIAPLGRWVLY